MKIGILAGGGPFPVQVAKAAAASGHEVFVVCIKDFCNPLDYSGFPSCEERIGAGGAILQRLRERGVSHLVLAGKARRPSLTSLWPDAWTANALRRIGPAIFSGDDALLRATIKLLAEEGFAIMGPQEFLTGATAPPGLLAGREPDEAAHRDIRRGVQILDTLSELDVGQSIVVQQGLVLGIEAVEGTDALIERAGDLAREGAGGVLIKFSKRGQELRVDAPVIGSQTILAARRAGLRGVAIEARHTLLADTGQIVVEAEKAGLFVIAIERDRYVNKM